MNYIDRLTQALQHQLRHPWSHNRSGGERVWFLVFEAEKTRAVIARKEAFRQATEAAGKNWAEIDITDAFGGWMASHRYSDRYFARPERARTLFDDFTQSVAQDIRNDITERSLDKDTLLALMGAESLYGIDKLSHLIRLVEDAIPGRLLVFFPGHYDEPQYRLLDARDGWNYLAVPIVPADGKGN